MKQRLPYGWAYMFRHRTLGELGRIVLEERDGGHTQVSREVVGNPADPMTDTRRRIFEPLALELTRRMKACTGPTPAGLRAIPLSRPSEPTEMIESKLMQCQRCDAFVAMLIFAPNATDPGRFEDYAHKMYPEYTRRNLPTWIIGPALGCGPLIDRPADILKIWPDREAMQRLRPEQFNPIVDELAAQHCNGGISMNLTAEQLQLAWKIHAKVEDLLEAGSDDMTIFKEMCDFMPQFKRLLDGSRQQRGVMDELCRRYVGFYRYATILETIAAGIASGEIKVPK